jgi:hypothetical protein
MVSTRLNVLYNEGNSKGELNDHIIIKTGGVKTDYLLGDLKKGK